MKEAFQPGQKFTVTNPDQLLFEEEWTITEVSYPTITFSSWKRWCVDREYMLPTSTDPLLATVVGEGLGGVLLTDANHNRGFWIKGNEATYLDTKKFQWYSSKLDSL